MSKKIIVFQHVPYETLGTFEPLLKASGFAGHYVNLVRDSAPSDPRPDLSRYAAMIVLGGPMNVDDTARYPNLATEVEVLREAVNRDMPVLGICLGAQLLARALGGTVRPGQQREIGWYDVELSAAGRADPVLSSFANVQRVFQWHEDNIELPPGCERLAGSAACPVQAFRHGERAYGLQFHLEVDRFLIERWLTVPANQPILDAERGLVDPEVIRRQTQDEIAALEAQSRETFGRWIDCFEPGPGG